MLGAGYWMLNADFGMLAADLWMLGASSPMLDTKAAPHLRGSKINLTLFSATALPHPPALFSFDWMIHRTEQISLRTPQYAARDSSFETFPPSPS